MKKAKCKFFFILIVFCCFSICRVYSQGILIKTRSEYESLKKNLSSTSTSINSIVFTENNSAKVTSTYFKACKEIVPVDSTFAVVPFIGGTLVAPPLYRNDDASTAPINIPFSFCFYGSSFNKLYINNNGNISFDMPQINYRPDSLPTTDFMAIAPFWADIDTRNFNSGVVYYKITAHYMIVTWDHVGYYNSHADKRNTFQLIITDGTDTTLLNQGKNVGFRYDQMQWTTGDIGGSNGFSLSNIHATVGANKSDSVHFVQFGRFGVAGSNYDGPYAGTDGVSWLNGRVFEFNACSSDNIEPIVNNYNYCDTIYSCVGDTTTFDFSFLSPENNQLTSTQISTTAASGLSVQQNTPGVVNVIKAKFIGNFSNVGFQHVYFTATDNGAIPASTTLDITIKINALNTVLNISGAPVTICPNDSTPLLATAGFDQYKWSNNDTANPMLAAPGSYFVTGKIGKCYFHSDTVHVQAFSVSIPQIQGSQTAICGQDSTLLSVTSVFPSYNWSNSSTASSSYFHPGTAYVTITDSNGCDVRSSDFIVPEIPHKNLEVIGIKPICKEDSLLISASSGFSNYLWNTGNTDTAIVVPAGYYSVSAVDSNNCLILSEVAEIPNFVTLQPNVVGQNNFCFGDSVRLSIPQGFSNYQWNNLAIDSVVFVKQGNYFFTAKDSNNCEVVSDTLSVSEWSKKNILISGSPYVCAGDSTLLTASAGFNFYNWTNGKNGFSIYANAGTYAVEGIDSNGCKSLSNSFQLLPYNSPNPAITGNSNVCPNDSVLLMVPPVFRNYLWNTGDTLHFIYASAQGNYSVQTIDSFGCFAQTPLFFLSQYPQQNINISGNNACCINDSVVLNASPGFNTYIWNNGLTGQNLYMPPGTYFVQATDSNNCLHKSPPFQINSFPFTLPVISGNTMLCKGDSIRLTVSPNYQQYLWSNGDTSSATYAVQGVYFIEVTDSNLCNFKSSNILVQNFPAYNPVIFGKNHCCLGDSVLLKAPNGFSQVKWNGLIPLDSIFAKQGNYFFYAIDSNNCRVQSLQHTVNYRIPNVNISGPTELCDGDSLPLSTQSSFAFYTWGNGSTQSTTYALPGINWVEISDSIGCKDADSVYIQALKKPTCLFNYFPNAPEAFELVQFLYSASDSILSYNWTIDGKKFSNLYNPTYSFPDSGIFLVHLNIASNNGCLSTCSREIKVFRSIEIPNVISPNSDGFNDVFKIKNINLSKSNRLEIFDRWGKLVYKSESYQNDWTAEGFKDGVYYYHFLPYGLNELIGTISIFH